MTHITEVKVPWKDPVSESELLLVFNDSYPVTPGHRLFVPKHSGSLGTITAFQAALRYGLAQVQAGACDDFDLGFNSGPAAGQTVAWPHVHCIPRRHGDCSDLTGGIRNVIPGRGNYKTWHKPDETTVKTTKDDDVKNQGI